MLGTAGAKTTKQVRQSSELASQGNRKSREGGLSALVKAIYWKV
jgi:hypothetical protein